MPRLPLDGRNVGVKHEGKNQRNEEPDDHEEHDSLTDGKRQPAFLSLTRDHIRRFPLGLAFLQTARLVLQHGKRQPVVITGLHVRDLGLCLLQLRLAEFDDRP
jgi:hypothetical protein